MTFKLQPGAVLKALPTSSSYYAVVAVSGLNDVNIVGGGIIEGERDQHQGTSGEGGRGILIRGSRGVAVDNITTRNNWGDGVYIGEADNSDIKICNTVSNNNRRQGMTIAFGSNIVIDGSVFSNTRGTSPEVGLNIEPNADQQVRNVIVRNSDFLDNAGSGFQSVVRSGISGASIAALTFEGNSVTGNGKNPAAPMSGPRAAVDIAKTTNAEVVDNYVGNNTGFGIRVREGARGSWVEYNVIEGTRAVVADFYNGIGIYIGEAPNSTIQNNTITGNDGFGIRQVPNDASVIIKNNKESGNGGN